MMQPTTIDDSIGYRIASIDFEVNGISRPSVCVYITMGRLVLRLQTPFLIGFIYTFTIIKICYYSA